MKVCVLGDAYHCERAAGMGLDFKNAEGLKNFNKNKKLIKKFGAHPRLNFPRAPGKARSRAALPCPPLPPPHLFSSALLSPSLLADRGRSAAQPRSTTSSWRRRA